MPTARSSASTSTISCMASSRSKSRWSRSKAAQPAIKLHADLTNAEMTFSIICIGTKPPAEQQPSMPISSASQNHDTELQNFKIVSDDIAAEGTIVVGADNKIKEFAFPSFMLNVVSRLDMRGRPRQGRHLVDRRFRDRISMAAAFSGRCSTSAMVPRAKQSRSGAAQGARVNAKSTT